MRPITRLYIPSRVFLSSLSHFSSKGNDWGTFSGRPLTTNSSTVGSRAKLAKTLLTKVPVNNFSKLSIKISNFVEFGIFQTFLNVRHPMK